MSNEYGDHIDFRSGTFHGSVIGVQHHYIAAAGSFSASRPVPVASCALPPKTFGFTGRQEELEQLLALLEPSSQTGPQLAVVHGMGGTGKTALVAEAAHAASKRGRFPGGALHLDLHGYESAPVTPDLALPSLLHALGVAPERVPASLADREALYRSALTRRVRDEGPVLIVLDDVSSAMQVRPLLPPTGACRTLITSRHRLSELHGVTMALDVLGPAESCQLLDHALRIADPDDDRITRDPDAAAALAGLCEGLPLALQIAAALLVGDSGQPTASLVDTLVDAPDRTAALDDGERSVHRAFDLSYRMLPQPQARLLRLLPLAPGPEVSTEVADALFGTPARRALHGLARAGLLGRTAERRWRLHDLVREYALRVDGDVAERTAAEQRLMTYYARTAESADRLLRNYDGDGEPFSSAARALAWLDGERADLVTTVLSVADGRRDATYALHLSFALFPYLHQRGHAEDLASVASAATRIADRQGDTQGMAYAYGAHGLALRELGDFEQAADTQTRALACFRDIGDTGGEAATLIELADALTEQSRLDEAFAAATRALELFESLDDPRGRIDAWSTLGRITRDMGRAQESQEAFGRVLELSGHLGDIRVQGAALYELGMSLAKFGEHQRAADAFDEAASIAARLDDWRGAIEALRALALLHEGQGHVELAHEHWERVATAHLAAGEATEAAAAREHARSL